MVIFRFGGCRWAVRRFGLAAVLVGLVTLGVGGPVAAGQFWAPGRTYWAWVYMDRGTPEQGVPVYDFRVNYSPMSTDGHQHVVLHTNDGTFKLPFELIREIRVGRSLGHLSDTVRYDVTVILRQEGEMRHGRLELVSMQGSVDRAPWHALLTARDDRGANLYRIAFVDPPDEG